MTEKEFKQKVINYVETGYYARALALLQEKVKSLLLKEILEKERDELNETI